MRTDVLIVGAGPTGLALACQLVRFGIDFIVLDKNETTTPHSKAIGVQARTLEIYEQIGLAAPLIDLGAPATFARMFAGGKVRGEVEFSKLGEGMSPYPYVLVVEQGKHETLLHAFIRSHGRIVEWNTELESFTQNESVVSATLRKKSGEIENVEAKFMVGCDGARSLIRHSLGLKFGGSTFERIFYVADVKLDWEHGHEALQVFLMRNSLLAFFPMTGKNSTASSEHFRKSFRKMKGIFFTKR